VLVVVGRIGRAHGIRGELTVEVRTDEPERRLAPGAVLVTDPGDRGPLTVIAGRVHGGRLLVRLAGVDSREDADALRDTLLLADVDPAELPEDEDEWYDHQLVGLDAVRPDGGALGEVREVVHLPGHDLLAISRHGAEVLVPFVRAIVCEVDLQANRVVVDPPTGLFEDASDEQPEP
jgi:16S rRNA processing protein RimM